MRPLREVLALPVRLHGIQLGRPVDALVDRVADRVVGFEVMCGDETRRFLPFAVARIGSEEIALESALTLVDERDLPFYRDRSRRSAELGYADPWLDEAGAIHETRSAA